MADPAKTVDQNLLPVQAYFDVDDNFQVFIGQGKPFYPTFDPHQSRLIITDSTIDSTTIGATSPSTGNFTNIDTVTGTISTTPSSSTDIVNKAYVDSIAQGLGPKQACEVGTTTNLTSLSGLPIIDTYQVLNGDRVLVKNQGTPSENGIYVASSSTWLRASDMDVWSEVRGAYTVLLNGSQADTGWVCTAVKTGTIGVTAMPWVQFANVTAYTAGTGLNLAANQFSIANTGVTATTYGTASKYLSLNINAQGQITSASESDIAISASQITSGTLDVVRGGTGQSTYTDGQLLIGNSSGNTLTKATLTAGAAISITNGNGSISIANTAPDQIVSLTGAGTTTVTGTYPNFTITSADQYTGTVTSVATGTGLTGGPITTTGTISFSNANVGIWAATPSSANLAAAMTDETGTGSLVFGTNPTLANPNIDVIDFSTSYSTPLTAGQLGWDGNDTLGLGMIGGNVVQHIGEDQFFYCKATSSITKGQVVMFTGAVGASGVPTGAPATGITDGTYIMGIAAEAIANNGFGLIQTFGTLRNVNTNGYADGDILWYNPSVAGGLTKTKPTAPNIKVQMAAVINGGSSGGGTILIRINPGSELGGTDSNVQFGTLSTNDLIQYNGTYWTNVASSLISVGTATNLAGGGAGYIPYQSGSGTTAFLSSGITGQVLTSNGSSAPTWTTPTAYATVTDDTTTNSTFYPLFANQTSGNITTEYTSSTKLKYNPSTGVMTVTGGIGGGAF